MRRLAAVIAVTLALVGGAATAAVAGGPDNVVVSDATTDATGAATFVAHQSMVVESTGTDELDSANVARATSHDCTGCQAIAVAFQAVLATRRPHVVAPRNLAVAENLNCNACASLAFAFQYVVTTDGPERLSPQGMQRLAALRQEVADDLATDLTPQDLNARLDDIGSRFKALVDAEIAKAGGTASDGEMHEQHAETPAGA
jgi:hypothetical protein